MKPKPVTPVHRSRGKDFGNGFGGGFGGGGGEILDIFLGESFIESLV